MKNKAMLLMGLAFIPLFCLRGGVWHHVFNFSYFFAAAAFFTAFLFIMRYLFVDMEAKKFKIGLFPNGDQPLLKGGELSILLWMVFVTVLMGLSYFYSPAPPPKWGTKVLSYMTMHFLLFYLYLLALPEQTLRKMVYWVCLIAVPVFSYQQFYSYYTTGSMLGLTTYHRAYGLMGDPNEFAKNVVVVILVLFFIVFFEQISLWPKILCFAGIVLMLLMLVWSGSRGGFVMLAAGALLFWLLLFPHFDRRKKIRFYIPFSLALVALGIFLSKYRYLSERFTDLVGQGGGSCRISAASQGLQLLFRGEPFSFLFGYGIEAWPSYVHLSIFPHNFIIEYLFEFGYITGLALMATLALALLYPLWDIHRRYQQNMIRLREYSFLKILFIVASCASIPSLFNHILPTNFTFIFFTGLYLSLYRFLAARGAAESREGGGADSAELLPQ